MNPTDTMDDMQWNMLIQDVADNFDQKTINRGAPYFEKGRVKQMTQPEPRLVHAVVDGTDRYSVKLNLDFFSMSHCNCPVGGPCKHMFAVIMAYADLLERPVDMLINAGAFALPKIRKKPTPQNVAYQQALQIAEKKKENQVKLQEQAKRIPTMSIPEWHELFELCNRSLENNTRNSQYVKEALTAINKIKPALPSILDELFSLHAHLFVLQQVTQKAEISGFNYGSYMLFHTHVAASDLQGSIERIFANKSQITRDSEYWPHVLETLTFLRKQMLMETQDRSYFLNQYDQLWKDWLIPYLTDGQMFEEELQHLYAAEAELGKELYRSPWLLAQSWMHFYLSQDQEALTLLKTLSNQIKIPLEHLFGFLYKLADTQDWTRLRHWLVEIIPLMEYRRDGLNEYSDIWDMVIEQIPEAEQQMWEALIQMLPNSYDVYEDQLLARGKWQQWIDYQLSSGSEPLDFRATVFTPIEKNAPELLLPFYHQAVERYILQKNRQSYKTAVKLLKRLAKLYKKMKKEPTWELFFDAFSLRHSRLRALQEELRKGKLLS